MTWDDPVELSEGMDWQSSQYPNLVSVGNAILPPEHTPAVVERLLMRLGFFVRRYPSSGDVPLMPIIGWEAVPYGLQVRTVMLPATTMATMQSDGDTLFLPVTEAIAAEGTWTQARTTMDLVQRNEGASFAVGYWVSDDGVNWGTYDVMTGDWVPNQFKVVPGTTFVDDIEMHYSTNADVDHPSGWVTVFDPEDPAVPARAFVQIGFLGKNTPATADGVRFGRLAAMIQFR